MELVRRSDALRQGLSEAEVRRLYTREGFERIVRGAYLGGGALAQLAVVDQHKVLIDALLPRVADDAALSHQSAAIAYGAVPWRVPMSRVHITRDRRNGGRNREQLMVHCAPLDGGVVELAGRLLTTPARTIIDLARSLPLEQAIVLGDQLVREFGVTAPELAAELEFAKRRKDIAAARRVVALLDGHSESIGESRSRVMFYRAGIRVPHTQGNVYAADGRLLGRADFYDPATGVIGEFDGKVKYGRLLKPGQDPGDAVFDEKQREDALRAAGHQVVRWIWPNLDGTAAIERWQQAIERAPFAPPPTGRIEQAALPRPTHLERRNAP